MTPNPSNPNPPDVLSHTSLEKLSLSSPLPACGHPLPLQGGEGKGEEAVCRADVHGLSAQALACWRRAQAQSPRRFTTGLLMTAVVLAVAHYTFGDWVLYPGIALWKEPPFWADIPSVAGVPIFCWVVWTLLSLGRLKPAPVILAAAAILCLGDLVWYLVWLNLKAVGLDYRRFADYWDWWAYWLPVVVLAGNLFLARRWWHLIPPAKEPQACSSRREEALTDESQIANHQSQMSPSLLASAATFSTNALVIAAVVLGSCAALLTAIHLVLPKMAVSDFTLSLADDFLVQAEWRKDFDFVVANSVSRGKRLGALLDHARLACLQRHHFYPALDESVYQHCVLSPVVDRLPLSELDWRRTLWEYFFPRVRHEQDPILAAQTVVRYLRQRVGIDPSYSYRVGVETIWTQQMTDANGFERIYVAALRSVGIAARLNERHRAELWTGKAWHESPRPIITSLSTTILR